MSSSSDLGKLKTEHWEQLQDVADRLEKAWEQAKDPESVPELKSFLPPIGSTLRSAALQELIKTDLEIRWRRDLKITLETYLERFPELGTASGLSPLLIYEEYRVRQLYGDKPAVETYQQRFPNRFVDLQRMIKDQPMPTMTSALPTPPLAKEMLVSADAPTSAGLSDSKSDFLSRFKWIKKIGSGGFGEVWSAEAPGGVPVAIKKIFRSVDNDESKRELESLELIKQLRHPFLLATQAYDQRENQLCIVMELADGSLRDRLKECRKEGLTSIPLAELLNYFREAADALDYLHSKRVMHRDIKPDNILTTGKHAKLADFGLARLQQEYMASASGSGSPPYMAPEVWRGKVGEHSDQYSLALSYAELRLGHRPFQSRDLVEAMNDHLTKIPDLDPLPAPEQKALLKALAKEPELRYPSCLEFVHAVEQSLAGELGKTGYTEHLAPKAPKNDGDGPAAGEGWATLSHGPRAPSLTDANPPSVPVKPASKPAGAWKSPATQELVKPAEKKGRSVSAILAYLATFCLLIMIVVAAWVIWKNGAVAPTTNREVDFLPENCVKAEDAVIQTVEGKKYYDKIDLTKDAFDIRFLLMPKMRINDPPTFYIMRDKVHVALFKKFAADRPMRDDRWKLGAVAAGKDTKNADGNMPVMRVCVEDAYTFARWLGGNLPTAKEWDKASGHFEPGAGKGPFQDDWSKETDPKHLQIAILRYEEGPLEVGKASKDVGLLGCRDMAGNGLEWTRDMFAPVGNEHEVPIHRNPDPLTDRVLIRGESYARKPTPFLFENLKVPEAYSYQDVKHDIGFRVVLEAPK